MNKYGIAIGRFQLFHNDHLKYLLASKQCCDILIVGITSPDDSYLIREDADPHRCNRESNPFSFFERMEMISSVLIDNEISNDQFRIVPFPIEKPELIRCYVPLDATAYITIYDQWGKEKRNRLEKIGFKVDVLWETTEKGLSATEVRQYVRKNTSWEEFVPKPVYDYIKEHNLEKRIIEDCRID